jgi:hypothetical protein
MHSTTGLQQSYNKFGTRKTTRFCIFFLRLQSNFKKKKSREAGLWIKSPSDFMKGFPRGRCFPGATRVFFFLGDDRRKDARTSEKPGRCLP